MSDRTNHLSQFELLQLHDGELDKKSQIKVLMHLSECRDCSLELEKIEGLSSEVGAFLRSRFPSHADVGQTQRLRTLLKRESLNSKQVVRPRHSFFTAAYAAIGLLTLGLSSYLVYQRVLSLQLGQAEILSTPNPNLTPGDSKPIPYADMCPAKEEDKDPPVSDATVRSVFKEYGISMRTKQNKFQVDYLISPQLGGTNQIRNLWPQPYEATIWNARVKDALEDRLHMMVCDGKIGLSEAQRVLAADWIGAYKLYFHTQTPIQTQAMVEK